MIPSINFESFWFNNEDFRLFSVNRNIFVFKLLYIYTYLREMCPIQLKLDGVFLSAEQNRTNRLVRLSSVIKLTEKFQFDYVRLPNQSKNNPTDWVRLSSIDFWFGFIRLATPGIVRITRKGTRNYLFALSQFGEPDYLGAWNRVGFEQCKNLLKGNKLTIGKLE